MAPKHSKSQQRLAAQTRSEKKQTVLGNQSLIPAAEANIQNITVEKVKEKK
ncbi:hypothetical protein ACHAP7_011062 [Fusarium lateritium]